MKTKIPSIAGFAAILILSSSAALSAQDDPKVSRRKRAPAQIDARLNIRFKGGSFSKFLEQLQAVHLAETGSKFNLIESGATDEIGLPSFELQNVQVGEALDATESVARMNNGKRRINVSRQSVHSSRSAPIYVVHVERHSTKSKLRARPTPTLLTSVYSTRQITTAVHKEEQQFHYPLDTVLGAIENALEVALDPADKTKGSERKIRHHSSSGLLFVRATPEAISVIDRVLSMMQSDISDAVRAFRVKASSTSNFNASRRRRGSGQGSGVRELGIDMPPSKSNAKKKRDVR